jgi:hypothetical protein
MCVVYCCRVDADVKPTIRRHLLERGRDRRRISEFDANVNCAINWWLGRGSGRICNLGASGHQPLDDPSSNAPAAPDDQRSQSRKVKRNLIELHAAQSSS